MALTIVATVGAANANSFVLLTEAETYMEGRGNKSTWTAASDGEKNIVLVEATRDIDALSFDGSRADETQALAWPRQYATDPDHPYQNWYDTDEVPVRVKNATCELAFQYLKAGTTDIAALDSKANVRRKRVDVLETEYFSPSETRLGIARYPRVMNWLRPLLAEPGVTARVVRG